MSSTSGQRDFPHRNESLPRGRDELILVVDDEESIRHLTQSVLEAYGYRVLTAKDGLHALELLAGDGAEIDLLLMDVRMPRMDGITALRELRRRDQSIKVIAVSGYCTPEQSASAAVMAVGGFLAKPFTAAKLLTAVREVIDSPPASGAV